MAKNSDCIVAIEVILPCVDNISLTTQATHRYCKLMLGLSLDSQSNLLMVSLLTSHQLNWIFYF